MSEVSGDFVYPGGDMTPEEFMRAEMIVDAELPKFQTEGVPYVDVALNGVKRRLHPFNTSVIRYDIGEPTMHDHMLYQGNPPEYAFYNEIDERALMLVELILEKDFPLLFHYEEPHPHVKEKLYQYMRGEQTIETITGRILGE